MKNNFNHLEFAIADAIRISANNVFNRHLTDMEIENLVYQVYDRLEDKMLEEVAEAIESII